MSLCFCALQSPSPPTSLSSSLSPNLSLPPTPGVRASRCVYRVDLAHRTWQIETQPGFRPVCCCCCCGCSVLQKPAGWSANRHLFCVEIRTCRPLLENGWLGYWLHHCVLRNSLAGSKYVVSMCRIQGVSVCVTSECMHPGTLPRERVCKDLSSLERRRPGRGLQRQVRVCACVRVCVCVCVCVRV